MNIDELPTNELQKEYYLENNTIVSEEELEELKKLGSQCPTVCAQVNTNLITNAMGYYLLRGDCGLFDPRETSPRYRVRHNWKMRKVNFGVFELYIRFLRTKRSMFLHQAERRI